MLAASLGGYAATTGALVGGLVGALHGCSWVPAHWWSQLQDEPQEQLQDDVPAGQVQHSEQHQQEPEAAAAAVAEGGQALQEGGGSLVAASGGADGAGVTEEQGGSEEWSLRPVSKYSVVVLGHQLADLDCKQAAPLM